MRIKESSQILKLASSNSSTDLKRYVRSTCMYVHSSLQLEVSLNEYINGLNLIIF